MASSLSSNNIGSLEVVDPNLPASVQSKLNDRMRRIQQAIAGFSTRSGANSASGVEQIVLFVPGTLAISSNLAPALTLGVTQSFSTIVALVKTAPSGTGSLTLQIYVNGVVWGPSVSLTSTSVTATISPALSIPASQIIRLDITAVGGTNPGADLTVILR
jgi:hypothetical protein